MDRPLQPSFPDSSRTVTNLIEYIFSTKNLLKHLKKKLNQIKSFLSRKRDLSFKKGAEKAKFFLAITISLLFSDTL